MLRNLIFQVHLYVGLVVGLLLVSAGLTGSVLVWRNEIDALLHPELLRVEPEKDRVTLERVLAAAREAYPQLSPSRVQMPRTPEQTFEVTTAGESPLQIYVHPYTGEVLGSRGEAETFSNWLFYWHTSLLSGETGEQVMGVSAILLLILLGTGLVVWWPGVRRLKDALTIRWRANWKRINYDLHRAVGVWTTVLLAVIAITGASLVFHDAFMAGLNRVTRSAPLPVPPPVTLEEDAPFRPVDALVRKARAKIPGEVTYVMLPSTAESPVIVRMKQAPELHPNGRNFVYLHPQTGEILTLVNALTAPAGTRAYNILYPLHLGHWGGLASRILYALAGLAPLVLFGSGLLMWRNRTGGKRRTKRPSGRRARSRSGQGTAQEPSPAVQPSLSNTRTSP